MPLDFLSFDTPSMGIIFCMHRHRGNSRACRSTHTCRSAVVTPMETRGCPFGANGGAVETDDPTERECYYSSYLQLDKILTAQEPESGKGDEKAAHDEMLFIIIHQTYELWFKQIIHELDAVYEIFNQETIPEKSIAKSIEHLRRVVEVQKLLVSQVNVIETMKPLGFLEFRSYLVPASGFQSYQFRLIENKLGMQAENRLPYQNAKYHTVLSRAHQAVVKESEDRESIFDLVEAWLERTPFLHIEDFDFWESYKAAAVKMYDAEEAQIEGSDDAETRRELLEKCRKHRAEFMTLLEEDKYQHYLKKGLKRLSFPATQAALLIRMYAEEALFVNPAILLDLLVDVDNKFTEWRTRHSLMVHRMIGTKIGTGGSSGYHYLKANITRGRVFGDISSLSTYLLPPHVRPELPDVIKDVIKLSFESPRSAGAQMRFKKSIPTPGMLEEK